MLLCQVYKGTRREEMYLYVERDRGTADVPQTLLEQFGELEEVMLLPLTADRRLARADAREVLASIEAQGYYLQMPPTPAELLARDRARD